MKLYSGPLSLFSAKVRVALAEKGLPYDLVSVPFSRKDGYSPKHPEVLRINPKAQVPVLVDGDLELFDSTLILEYLEDRHPEPPLYPRDLAMRACCRQAEAAADEILFPHILALIQEVFYGRDPAARDEAKIAAAHAAIAGIHRGLDARLGGTEWLCGPFSVADIGTFLTIMFAAQLGAQPDESLRNLAAWQARVAERPSIRKEIAEMAAAAARA
jgi:glutathione S-transferase